MTHVEHVCAGEALLAYLVRGSGGELPTETTFLTPPEATLQVGHIVYGAGQEIQRHVHLPVERHLVGSSEVLLVERGRCLVDFYTDERVLVETREMRTGDILIAVGGGHGFRLLEDTVLLEVKQGPYPGMVEKAKF